MKKNMSSKKIKKLAIFTVTALTLIAVAFVSKTLGKASNEATNIKTNETTEEAASSSTEGASTKDSDIVIQVKDISDQPTFISAEVNGTNMEVIAVKASDGTIRTAFNTCQVCYDSGRGYYKVEDNQLVCQNCGNRFTMDDVEVTKGGCNPIPITEESKTVNDETIIISKDVLSQAATMFGNWR